MACAAGPVVIMLSVNRVFGSGATLSQFNLGHTIHLDMSAGDFARAWWNFTDLGFYDYHWFSHWFFAVWPVALLSGVLIFRGSRRAFLKFTSLPEVRLSIAVTVSSLAMLIAASGLFGDKYDYVGLERYYLPIRPLYVLLFVAPISYVPLRTVKAVACVGLALACSWLVEVEWTRPYKRRLADMEAVTPYGQWARCFEPGAADLYGWLDARAGSDIIVLSNFHEYIALETGIAALPIPKDEDTLNDWVERRCVSRGVTSPRVLFVLDTENKDREYWIASPDTIVRSFALTGVSDAPPGVSARIMEFAW